MKLARSNFSIILKWEYFIVSGEYRTEQSRCLDKQRKDFIVRNNELLPKILILEVNYVKCKNIKLPQLAEKKSTQTLACKKESDYS